MGGKSSPIKIIFLTILIILFAIKIKDSCYYCFFVSILLGLIFFIFGLLKFWKQRNG